MLLFSRLEMKMTMRVSDEKGNADALIAGSVHKLTCKLIDAAVLLVQSITIINFIFCYDVHVCFWVIRCLCQSRLNE